MVLIASEITRKCVLLYFFPFYFESTNKITNTFRVIITCKIIILCSMPNNDVSTWSISYEYENGQEKSR